MKKTVIARLNSIEQQIVKDYGPLSVVKGIIIRPVTCHGSGRYSSNYRSTKAMIQITNLRNCGKFTYISGNDAPRGGATGEFHDFTPIHKRVKLGKIIKRAKHIQDIRRNRLESEAKEAQEIRIQNTLSNFDNVKERFIEYAKRKGLSMPLSCKDANQVAWKKQHYIDGGTDIVTLRRCLLDYTRELFGNYKTQTT